MNYNSSHGQGRGVGLGFPAVGHSNQQSSKRGLTTTSTILAPMHNNGTHGQGEHRMEYVCRS